METEIEKVYTRKLDTVKIARENMPDLDITVTRYECRNENGKTVYMVKVKFGLSLPKALQEEMGRKSLHKENTVQCESVEDTYSIIMDLMRS